MKQKKLKKGQIPIQQNKVKYSAQMDLLVMLTSHDGTIRQTNKPSCGKLQQVYEFC